MPFQFGWNILFGNDILKYKLDSINRGYLSSPFPPKLSAIERSAKIEYKKQYYTAAVIITKQQL